jgi:hydrogenase expression/formation protein HypE
MSQQNTSSGGTHGGVAGSDERIVLAHGGGGELTDELIRRHVLPQLGNEVLNRLGDAATLELDRAKLALTTDSYVVQPLFFPGGDIGRLAVCGTVNDLAMAGAEPTAISLALILEEGLETEVLARVLESVSEAARDAGVTVVAGDTKVVDHGRADGMYINTTGLGRLIDGVSLGYEQVLPGDKVLVSGTIAEHGLAVLSQRRGLSFASELVSDVAALAHLANRFVRELDGVRLLRDPTRGGLAGVVADIVAASGHSVEIDEASVPITSTARAAAELLGLDPLDVANEGKFVAVVCPQQAEHALKLCRDDPLGHRAALVGRVTDQRPALAELLTKAGGRRVVQKPYGEELPRIC